MSEIVRTKLDKKMDRIKEKEEAGLLGHKPNNRVLRKFSNNKLALIGLLIFILIILTSIFAPVICRYDPGKIDVMNKLQAPSFEHILGTDKVGRDVFARIVYGGRISILVGLGSALGAAAIGVLFGCYAGYKGGWLIKPL